MSKELNKIGKNLNNLRKMKFTLIVRSIISIMPFAIGDEKLSGLQQAVQVHSVDNNFPIIGASFFNNIIDREYA